MHGLLSTQYEANDVPETGADQRTDGGHEDYSYAIFFTQFLEKCVDCERLLSRAVSVAVSDENATVRDGLPDPDVATSRVDG